MRGTTSSARFLTFTVLFPGCLVVAVGLALGFAAPMPPGEPREAPAPEAPKPQVAQVSGKELFTREWIAGDPRSHGGDGLGPMFNDSSCVACHNQGGIGGGGPASKNVHIMTRHVAVKDPKNPRIHRLQQQSFVLHHFGTDSDYAKWRAQTAGSATMVTGGNTVILTGSSIPMEFAPQRGDGQPQSIPPQAVPPGGGAPAGPNPGLPQGGFASGFVGGRFFPGAQISQRNTTALFGAGAIDEIDERTLEEVASIRHKDFPAVSGRVARDANGRLGRFGWKAQKADLKDFVLTACAVEVGLHVPGHEQPPMPHKPKYKSPGLDMSEEECDTLVNYVRNLPSPTELIDGAHPKQAEYLKAGKTLFTSVGCAACHTEDLGEVAGIYSDLLLHDMGASLSDQGSSYGVLRPDSPSEKRKLPKPPKRRSKGDEQIAQAAKKPPVVATAREWRTPPLWGVRDSAPYLHDGRAKTLQHAIALHGGEAVQSTRKYNALSGENKQNLIAFLKSLVAPGL